MALRRWGVTAAPSSTNRSSLRRLVRRGQEGDDRARNENEMQSLKRWRGDGDSFYAAKRLEERRLYLIFDDWPWGYSICEIDLRVSTSQKAASSQNGAAASGNGAAASSEGADRHLPQPIICLEAPRGYPLFFAAVGTRIVATHPRDPWDDGSVPGDFMPIVDVRSRGVTFGPGQMDHDIPIYLPVHNGLLALDNCTFSMLSFEPLWPPRLEIRRSSNDGWSWRKLPEPPFSRLDVTAYIVSPDETMIMVSTNEGTFTLDIGKIDTEELVWMPSCNQWTLPFTGRGYFVSCLGTNVGLSKDPATLGHLVGAADGGKLKLCKEKLFSQDPAETHVGATLIHMQDGNGDGNEFCLVQCVSVEHGNDDQELKEGGEEVPIEHGDDDQELKEGGSRHLYRLTTFSVSYDNNGDLTTGGTCKVQCYKVPKQTTERFLDGDPVAFWL
nr:uncharacterized protein LOC117851993 [Setaria viridis]